MAFTEFCCRSGGSNLNAGTRTGNSTEPGTSASFTYASGSWVASTGVFTVASGNPSTDGVAVGDFASVYADGSTVTGFVGRVTAVSSTTITVSTTAKAGTAPTDGTSNRTLRIGGAWQGPNGSSGFPLTLVQSTATNAAGDMPRINLKNDQTYTISAAISVSNAGPYVIGGYASSYGDTGRATFATSGTASFVPLTISGANVLLRQVIVGCATFTSGFSNAIVLSGTASIAERCVVSSSRNNGFTTSLPSNRIVECEAYSYGAYGFDLNNGGACIRCIAHDGTAGGSGGFRGSAGAMIQGCIADTCPGPGFVSSATTGCVLKDSVAYNCTSHGLSVTAAGLVHVENCIFANNGGWGVNNSSTVSAQLYNCAFRSNTSGTTTGQVDEYGTVSLSADPFTDAANGDFRLNATAGGGAAMKAAGRGLFTQTASSYSGTVSYPDIGAAQSQASASGGGSLINSQQLVRQGWIG